jgi:hypothetical protein
MDVKWQLLITVVRCLFLLIPHSRRIHAEFGFTEEQLGEAKEYVNACNCHSILISFPIGIFILVLSQSDKGSSHLDPFRITVFGITCLLLLPYLAYKTKPQFFRATLPPILILIVVTVFEAIFNAKLAKIFYDYLTVASAAIRD